MEGTIIGQYRIVRKLGAGGMSVVYLAEHMLVGNRAAIKVLLPELSVRRSIVLRFFNEARAMTSIPDPGIARMYDFGFHSDGVAYIVMELLEGETLSRRVRRLRRLPPADAVRITRQVAGSVATAHAAGIIHRDLKPENIFVVRDPEALGGERPKVLDFGVAKLSGDVDRSQTLAGAMMGTPAYMSPEQCRGAGEVDARSDIYSLGCVLVCLVTGRPPFDRVGIGELISAHMNDAPKRPSEGAPDVPVELDEIVLRCLAKSPDDRFQSMLELQAACDGLLVQLGARELPSGVGALGTLPPGFRSHASGSDALPADALPANPTTLSSAVGVTSIRPRPPRRIGVWLGFAGTLVAAGIAAVIAMVGASDPSTPARPAVAPAGSPPAATVDADAQRAASGPAVVLEAGVAVGAASVDAALAPPDDATTTPAASDPASKAKRKMHRQTPARDDDLYDDR